MLDGGARLPVGYSLTSLPLLRAGLALGAAIFGTTVLVLELIGS
jgi:uncharacterized membrane protein